MANKNKIINFKKKTKKQRGGAGPPSGLSASAKPFTSTSMVSTPVSSSSNKVSNKQTRISTTSTTPLPTNITIGTYNILFPGKFNEYYVPSGSPVGFNYLPSPYKPNSGKFHQVIFENSVMRRDIMINNLINADLDIVCLQEVSNVGSLSSVYTTIVNNELLKDQYNFSKLQIHPTFSDVGNVGHGVMILYKKKKFNLISDDSVLIPNAKNRKLRFCSIVSLEYNKKKICVVSCHFYDSRDYIKNKNIQMDNVLAAINKKECDLNIIAGDFNQDQYGDLNVNGELIYSREPNGPKKASVFKPLSLDTEDITQRYTFDDDLLPSEYTKNIDSKTPSTYNTTIIPKTNIYGATRRIDWIFCNDKNGRVPNTISLHNFDFRASDHSLKAVSINL